MAGLLAAYCQFVINDLAHELLRQRDMWMLAVLVVSYASLELRRVWLERRAQKLSQYPWHLQSRWLNHRAFAWRPRAVDDSFRPN